ncbi:MAG TPA: methylmalonyl-CoA mutase family protein, partial [Terriglobales bacterium]|nr:methylmalonyl-CoA mutase family protein [Terriglobales bacterium]
GSYFVESLTNEIEKRAWNYLDKIKALGGMLKAIERGYVQQEIQNASYDFQQSVESQQQIIVGVNKFRLDEENPVPIQRIDESLEKKQVERTRALRARRDPGPWKESLARIEEAARSGANLMPHIIHAVESYATVGEISDTLRKVFGEYKEAVVI